MRQGVNPKPPSHLKACFAAPEVMTRWSASSRPCRQSCWTTQIVAWRWEGPSALSFGPNEV